MVIQLFYKRFRRISLLVILCTATTIAAPRTEARPHAPVIVHKDSGFTIAMAPKTIKQGDTVTVFVDSHHTLRGITVYCFSKLQNTFKIKDTKHPHLFRTFVGISALQKPGNYTIRIYAVTNTGVSRQFSIPLTVKPADFQQSHITIPKQKSGLLQSKELPRESSIIGASLKKMGIKPYFSDAFGAPANGQVSSPFGTQRVYNNGVVAWYHRGMDIANRLGTPIIAANSGVIEIAEKFEVHGNTVMIDHGHCVMTVYNHMDKIVVKKGDRVRKGEILGYMGSTGVSTGPHLHFGVSVSDVRVNPQQWIDDNVALDYDL